MRLNALAVASSDIPKTVEFYSLLGFKFKDVKADADHVDSVHEDGETRLMIDSVTLMISLIGEVPRPANHSAFAIECDSPEQVNQAAKAIADAGFTVNKEPWDAFWGQRYCVVQDPDGYLIDLYAGLNNE